MDDLDRLFRYLVDHLARTAPERLQKPFQVSELYQRLVPYRMHRAALGFDSIEDYELTVLRLLAGESGYASVDPPDAQAALAEEVRQVDPNPGAFRDLYRRLRRRCRMPDNQVDSIGHEFFGDIVSIGYVALGILVVKLEVLAHYEAFLLQAVEYAVQPRLQSRMLYDYRVANFECPLLPGGSRG